MRNISETAQIMVAGAVFGVVIYLILAPPGILSDASSTIPDIVVQESRR